VQRSLEGRRTVGDRRGLAQMLDGLGNLALDEGNLGVARTHL
jgi:hypothetical protein